MKSPVSRLFGASLLALSAVATAADVDPALPGYEPVSGVSGNFSSVGSDTLNNLMTLWAEEFKGLYLSLIHI